MMHLLLKAYFLLVIFTYSIGGYSQSDDGLESSIDSIIQIGIDSMAFPGCQIVIMHKGAVAMRKSYGYHTYDKKVKVENDHIYDLASLTKVTSGLPLVMKLVDEGKIDIDLPISTYIPYWKGSNKEDLTLRQLLAHQAGLQPYIVFWAESLQSDGRIMENSYAFSHSAEYPLRLSEDLYLHKNYKEVIREKIKESEVSQDPVYKYSGLLFLLLPELITHVSGDDYLTMLFQQFYMPLGLHRICYNPLNYHKQEIIVPTEMDAYFRHEMIKGRVHDETAAMLGGVSCNAGLFSDAQDVATLFQFYLDGGKKDNDYLISQETIASFTSYQYEGNRRGLGFDKPLIEYNKNSSYVSEFASSGSFGHSGFTGTFAWADPSNQTVIVFLSNRVYPYRNNRKLYSLNIRPQLHDVLYAYFPKKD